MRATKHNDAVPRGQEPAATGSGRYAREEALPPVRGPSRAGSSLLVALLSGGGDKPYALGLASALTAQGICLDFIGSDRVDGSGLHETPLVNFLNLRGDQSSDVCLARKALRLLAYYWRLVVYAVNARPPIFHILWNEKLEYFDRTALMFFFRLLGKRIVFTAHNVNAGKRDANDSLLNRLTLKVQYQLSDHIFVHTEKMKKQLLTEFGASECKVSIIPLGINSSVPNTKLAPEEAKRLLGVRSTDKTMLFFGRIAPYKGLEFLIAALGELACKDGSYRLIIVGKPKGCDDYWSHIQEAITRTGIKERVIERIEFIPDEQTELYFKAADVLVLPYSYIFQSGVLVLGYSFGLPVIASDVGSLREEIVEGKTGYLFRPKDSSDLAKTVKAYFSSALFLELENRRQGIRDFANDRYSWNAVGEITRRVYHELLKN